MVQNDIEGVIAVLLTQFDEDEKPNLKALEPFINFLLDRGVQGLFVCGSYGLGPLMSTEERKRVLEAVIRINNRRVPIIAQIGAIDTRSTIELAVHAQDSGVNAVISLPPFYIPSEERSMLAHFQAVIKAVEIPVYAYNNLWAGNLISPKLFSQLIEIGYKGMKDAGEDFSLHCHYHRLAPPYFNLLMGTEKYALPSLVMGVRGFTSGTVNAFPEINVRLYKAYKRGDLEEAVQFQQQILRLMDIISMGPGIQVTYECVHLRGIDIGKPKMPLAPIDSELKAKIEEKLEEMKIL